MNDTLHKIFLVLLSASIPGEIINARDKLKQVADVEGYDIFALASALALPNRKTSASDLSTKAMAQFCWERRIYLSEKEQKFVSDMTFKWKTKPSEKQAAWLQSIYVKLKG
jgi:regulator of sigma D